MKGQAGMKKSLLQLCRTLPCVCCISELSHSHRRSRKHVDRHQNIIMTTVSRFKVVSRFEIAIIEERHEY